MRAKASKRPVSILLLAAMLLILAGMNARTASDGHSAQMPARSKTMVDAPRLVALTLKVPFTLLGGSTMVIADPNSAGGLPREAFQRIWLVFTKSKKAIAVDGLGALRGYVQISSPAQALGFCRLATSPATHFVLGDEVEVVCREDLTVALCFGDARRCSLARSWPSGMGVESRSTLHRLCLSRARARVIGKQFEVRRTLLKDVPTGGARLVDVVETVTRDGGYSRRVLRERAAPVGFMVPYYM